MVCNTGRYRQLPVSTVQINMQTTQWTTVGVPLKMTLCHTQHAATHSTIRGCCEGCHAVNPDLLCSVPHLSEQMQQATRHCTSRAALNDGLLAECKAPPPRLPPPPAALPLRPDAAATVVFVLLGTPTHAKPTQGTMRMPTPQHMNNTHQHLNAHAARTPQPGCALFLQHCHRVTRALCGSAGRVQMA